ncbi:terminase [Pseudomonas syringae]|nr:terminase [Pseudomonas syringae]
MGKRHPNFPAWQWRIQPQSHKHPTNLGLQLIAAPLLIIGVLLIASGVFSLSAGSIAVGVVGVLAGVVLQRHGRKLESLHGQHF